MGCQKKIAEKKADYVISLKGNQQSIHNDVKDFFDHLFDKQRFEQYKIQHLEYDIEIGHSRIEKRECYLCTNRGWLAEKAHMEQTQCRWHDQMRMNDKENWGKSWLSNDIFYLA